MRSPTPFRFFSAAVAAYARWERWILAVLAVLFVVSLTILLHKFRKENTLLVPTTGGTYIEGSVGELQPLNPWFTITNDVNRDIASLVFSGLLRFNPQSKKIEDDLATMEVSKDGKVYTLRLKEKLFWHDTTEESPHPVTSDDVVFTYKTMQDPDFPNSLLRQNFKGVTIERIDDRTVQFRLEQPYSFFSSNLTIGLLPERAFEGSQIADLDQDLSFGFAPIGAGPYKFKSVIQTDLSTEVTLERFPRELTPVYRLDRVVFRIFSDYPTLLSDIRNLDGIRLAPHTDRGEAAVPRRFTARSYTLPQYVGLFFNLDRPTLKDQKLRLGLRLGTDKQAIVDAVGESVILDTPLLQINTADWEYKFDPAAAQGALFESEWYFPEKIRLQRLLEQRETNKIGAIRVPLVARLSTGAALTMSGTFAAVPRDARINGVPLTPQPTNSGAWIVALPTAGGSGTLKIGLNLLKLTAPDGKILDSAYVLRTVDDESHRKALDEQQLVELFQASKDPNMPADQKITVQDMFLDGQYLRRRFSTDPVGIRVNDAGQRLSLTLLTSPQPEKYKLVAEEVKREWEALGVHVNVEVPATREEFESRLLERQYDVLLFGQSLLDNLDSYPYWHSSGVQQLTGKRSDLKIDAYNLSQYASFEADSLLEQIRKTTNEKERQDALAKLADTLKTDAPAIILYTPLYTFAQRDDILGVELGSLSMHSDRFLTLHRWYVKQERIFKAGVGWLSFPGWVSSLVLQRNAAPDVSTGA